jgi:hypothetical protein
MPDVRTLSTIVVFLAALSGAIAQNMLLPAVPSRALAPPSAEVSLQGHGDHDETCAEWTDRCRTCRRTEAGEQICSNIGPACQPAAISCARRAEPAK